MPNQTLPPLLPDIVVLITRDGVLLEHIAGRGVLSADKAPEPIGRPIESMWPASVSAPIKQLVRHAIADRSTVQGHIEHGDGFQVRVTAQGPDRAICVIRAQTAAPAGDAAPDGVSAPRFDRRGFLRRLKDSMASGALREKPTAVAVIHVDGLAEITRIIDMRVSNLVIGAAVERLQPGSTTAGEPMWYLGQLSDSVLALVVESADRDAVEACVAHVCESLREPIKVGDAAFSLTPYAGVAILGQDANSPRMLIDHARAAANEARNTGKCTVRFFSDTLRLRSLARLDIAQELRAAIAERAIRLRYFGRYDLATGRRVAHVGYLHWQHPVRGEVRAAEFVGVAEATGLARFMSRSALACLLEDFPALRQADPDVRISFGALRHHLLHEDFVADIAAFVAEGAVPAERLELRISERTLMAQVPSVCESLKDMGIQLVVDEVGRGMSSLDQLARASLWGLQLDRSWAVGLRHDPVALKVCRAGMAVAASLGLTPIATGVDDEQQRQALLVLGCRQGMGDFYPHVEGTTREMPEVRRSGQSG
ncbi:MAG TPA: EAL domain-containing protein [Steroidobacteraceae bacterium]|nr:EAL domain-containing protein [Steroidobacteraceae bacterium]